jgi:cytochrome c1
MKHAFFCLALCGAAAMAAAQVEITPPASAVTASTNDGNVPGNAVDSSLSTRWSGNGDGAWLQLDLGTVKTVSFVKVGTFNGHLRRGRFEIQVATTAGAWTTALPFTETSGTTTTLETFDFPDVPARWVRYLGHGNTDPAKATWNSVTELNVWGR